MGLRMRGFDPEDEQCHLLQITNACDAQKSNDPPDARDTTVMNDEECTVACRFVSYTFTLGTYNYKYHVGIPTLVVASIATAVSN